MLRILQESYMKPNDTMNRTASEMTTGMGVIKNLATKEIELPETETGLDIYLLDKERYPTTIVNSIRRDVSDYDPDFNEYEEGELAKINPPQNGDRFAVDQYIAGLIENNYMAVGTDGKWKNAESGIQSIFKYGGIHNSDGHDLAIIQVMSTAGTN